MQFSRGKNEKNALLFIFWFLNMLLLEFLLSLYDICGYKLLCFYLTSNCSASYFLFPLSTNLKMASCKKKIRFPCISRLEFHFSNLILFTTNCYLHELQPNVLDLDWLINHYGPARAGPFYEIRIWEAHAFLRDECINWV